MINKKLLSFDRGALRYVGANVAFQWLGMLCNVIFVLAVLGVSLNLYQNGKMGVEGVLVCTLSALSSFGPVVALANLGASLTQVFASASVWRVPSCMMHPSCCWTSLPPIWTA